MACLLCQRGFASLPQLQRHVEQSQLHAKNLDVHTAKEEIRRQRQEEQRRQWTTPTPPPTSAPPVPPSVSSHNEGLPVSEVSDVSADASMSVGERIMAKQGWRGSGHGLGKSQQGRAGVIQVQEVQSRAGIGSSHAAPAPVAGGGRDVSVSQPSMDGPEGYKLLIRKKAQERFQAVQTGGAAPELVVTAAAPTDEAARHYLSLLEKARAVESEELQHKRPLMK